MNIMLSVVSIQGPEGAVGAVASSPSIRFFFCLSLDEGLEIRNRLIKDLRKRGGQNTTPHVAERGFRQGAWRPITLRRRHFS